MKYHIIKYIGILTYVTISQVVLFNIAAAQLITRGTAVTTYQYELGSDPGLTAYEKTLNEWNCINQTNTDLTIAPCYWNIFKVSELKPAVIATNLLCRKVFETSAMPADTTRHLMAITDEKFNQLTMANGKITSVPMRFYGSKTNPEDYYYHALTLTWPHTHVMQQLPNYTNQGPPKSAQYNADPVTYAHIKTYGKVQERFIISHVFTNDSDLVIFKNLAGIDAKDKTYEIGCVNNEIKYGKGTLANIIILDQQNQKTENRIVCLYNNTYNENGDGKMIVIDYYNGKILGQSGSQLYSPFLYFWSETPESIPESQAINIAECATDTDKDGIKDYYDFCPYIASSNGSNTDSDGDGVGNDCDNCPDSYNPFQQMGKDAQGNDTCIIPLINTCNSDNYTDYNLCDIVTTTEKQELAPKPFNALTIKLKIPNFTFKDNVTNTGRNCKIGKVKVGAEEIVDCNTINETDVKFKICELGCNMQPDDTCFYYANIQLPPLIISQAAPSAPGIASFFSTPTASIKLNFEVNINSDYLSSSPGNYNNNILSPTYETTQSSATSNHVCNLSVTVQKEIATLDEASCTLTIGSNSYDNIINLDDFIKAATKNLANCGN